jgi:putative transposase
MPSRFVARKLRGNSYYHIFNRGLESRRIFLDKDDYLKFLYYFYVYTLNPQEVKSKYGDVPKRIMAKSLYGEIFLVAYSLMPDHFHLLIKQRSDNSMSKLLKQIVNAYITYFNAKYNHQGTIFQGRYKAVRIDTEVLLMQMVRFVHLNPILAGLSQELKNYPWSSFVDPIFSKGVMNRFQSVEEWRKFNSDIISYRANYKKIKDLAIDGP